MIGNLTTTDVDSSNFTYSVDDERFEVIDSQLKLKAGETLDAETESSITVNVTVTDDGSPVADFTQSFTLTVNNVNDAPTAIALDNNTVTENADGAVIGNLTTTDIDSSNFTYSVDDERFEVIDSQLKLKAGETLDAETESSITVNVTVTDDGSPVADFTQSFTLTVENVNEAPVVSPEAPSQTQSQQGEELNLNIGEFFTDPDGESLTFSAEGLPNGLSINPETGEITGTTDTAGDFEITVTATDAAGATISQTFGLMVNAETETETETETELQPKPLPVPPPVVAPTPPVTEANVYDITMFIPSITKPVTPSNTSVNLDSANSNSGEPTPNADVIIGDAEDNQVFGLGGNDTLSMGGGNDWVSANQGNDLIDGGQGDDIIHAGKDNDTVFGSARNDWMNGNKGADFLNGGENNDTVYGGKGSDLITDFTDNEDIFLLDGGLTFEQLTIVEERGSTLIKVGEELLATVENVSASLITQDDFTNLF